MKRDRILVRNPVGDVFDESVPGQHVGPFFVHRTLGSGIRWTVTHTKTGFAVQQNLQSRRHALWLVRKLRAFDCWGFDEAKAALEIPEETLQQIHALRADAAFGGCQGDLSK